MSLPLVSKIKKEKFLVEMSENGAADGHSYDFYDEGDDDEEEEVPEPWIPEEYIRPKWIHDTANDITRMKRKTAAENTVEAIQGWKMPEKPKIKPKRQHYQTDQRAMSVIQTVLDSTGHKGRTLSTTNAILGLGHGHATRSSSSSGWVLMSTPKIMTATANKQQQQSQVQLQQQQQQRPQKSQKSPEKNNNGTAQLVDLDLTSLPMFPSSFKGMTVQEMVQKMANQGKLVLENGKLVFRQPPGSEEMDLTVNVEPRYEDDDGLQEEELSPIITKVESIQDTAVPIPIPKTRPRVAIEHDDRMVIKTEEADEDPLDDPENDDNDDLDMDVIKPEAAAVMMAEESDPYRSLIGNEILGGSSDVTYSYYAEDFEEGGNHPGGQGHSSDEEGESYQIELMDPEEAPGTFTTTVGQFKAGGGSVVRRVAPSGSRGRDEGVFKRPSSFPSSTMNLRKIPISILRQAVQVRTRKQKLDRVDPSSVVPVSVTNSTASSASESDLDIGEFPTDEDESESEIQQNSRKTVWVVPSRHHNNHKSANSSYHPHSSRSPSPNDLPEFELDEPEFILTTGHSIQEVSPPKKRKQKHEPQPHTDGKIYPKPAFSYSCLIAMALKNSKTGSLPVSEIYKFMCDHFPYFKSAPSGWKNSVRHNLSLNKCFEKIEKPGNGARKGCLWALNPAKIHKMDEEVQKWSRKDPLAIRRAMSDPENLELIERGELKRDYSGNGASDEDDEEDISEPCTPLTQAQLLARRSRGSSSSDSYVGETTTVSSTTPTTKVSQVHAITLNRPIEQKIHVKSEPMDTLDFGTITNVQGNYLCHTGAGTGTYTLSFSPLSNATTPIIIRRTPVK